MTEFETLQSELKRLRKLIAKHEAKHALLYDTFLKTCPHDNVVVKKEYTSGGYLNTGYTETWNECTVCHQRGPVTSKSDGMFG